MTMHVLLAILAALLLSGCGLGFTIRAGVNMPGGYEPYVEVRVDAAERRDANRPANAPPAEEAP